MVGSMYRLVSPPPCYSMGGTCWTAFGLQGGGEGENEKGDDAENEMTMKMISRDSRYSNILYI